MSDGQMISQQEYSLPRELDLLAAENLKDTLLDLLQKEGDLVIDASDVERISTPCIEILFAAGTTFGEADRKFQINNPSEYFSDALTALGLNDHFQRWRAS